MKIIIILISYLNLSVFTIYISFKMIFILDYEKMHKKQKFSALAIVEYLSKEMWSNSYVTFVDITAQASLTPCF